LLLSFADLDEATAENQAAAPAAAVKMAIARFMQSVGLILENR
jgi:hypothetical protein